MPPQGNNRLITVIDRLALLIAVSVALVFPIGFSALTHRYLSAHLDTLVQVKAGTITDLVSGNPSLWSYQVQRLEDVLIRNPVPTGTETVSAYDANDVLIISVGHPAPPPPLLLRSLPLHDNGVIVGRVEVALSLRGLIESAALAAMLGLALGGTLFAVFRAWPLRALRQMGIALDAEQAALKTSEDRYRSLVQWSLEVIVVHRGGKILFVNDAGLKVFGKMPMQKSASNNILNYIHPDFHQLALDRLKVVADGGNNPPMAEMKFLKLDGTAMDAEVQSTWIVSDGGPAICSYICDISERRQAEAARILLEQQLRESQKMQAIGTLAGGIAHDFNNILATILGNTELARQDIGDNRLVMESLDEIAKASARARDLVKQILAFSRRQPTEKKRITLGPIIAESAHLLRATLPTRISLSVFCETDVPPVLAEATQIQQVVINLCTNAMQAFRGAPGRIGIRLDSVMLDSALTEAHPELLALRGVPDKSPGRMVRLAVSDDGPGMDTATQARIFEPFFTTKQVNEGTGLGLSVVHGIVRTHEGAIVVESQPGKGATFTLYLPAAEPEDVAHINTTVVETRATETPAATVTHQHILYLDDEEALVFLIVRMLEQRGYRVTGFFDPSEAIAAVRADPAGFDLVVTDYNMPNLSGLDVARAVRDIRADLPVVVVSGFIDETLHAEAAGAGVSELIFKTNAMEEFCEALVRLVQHGPQSTESKDQHAGSQR